MTDFSPKVSHLAGLLLGAQNFWLSKSRVYKVCRSPGLLQLASFFLEESFCVCLCAVTKCTCRCSFSAPAQSQEEEEAARRRTNFMVDKVGVGDESVIVTGGAAATLRVTTTTSTILGPYSETRTNSEFDPSSRK